MTIQHFRVPLSHVRRRLDVVIADLAAVSRSHAKRLIANKRVLVQGQYKKASYPARIGESIEIAPLPPLPFEARPESIPLDILYEDSSLAVINKPPGMVVHPAPGQWHGTVVNAILGHWGWETGERTLRPGIVPVSYTHLTLPPKA